MCNQYTQTKRRSNHGCSWRHIQYTFHPNRRLLDATARVFRIDVMCGSLEIRSCVVRDSMNNAHDGYTSTIFRAERFNGCIGRLCALSFFQERLNFNILKTTSW